MRRIFVPFGENEAYQGMNGLERKMMIERHRKSLDDFGLAPETLFYKSRKEQDVRFEALTEIGIRTGDSLLDVGCGFCDLVSWLNGQEIIVDYTGIDLSPDILAKSFEINPDLKLQQGEVFDFDWSPQTFDWVFLSGTLNWNLADGGDYALRVIKRMFKLCRSGVAFNLLDIREMDASELGGLTAYDPEKILKFCMEITPHCHFRNDYADHDFTIYMKRAEI